MLDLAAFLKEMISAPGLSGNESPVREIIAQEWRPLVDELKVSRMGSLEGLRKGSGKEPRPSLMLATHMDAIGMMVTAVTDDFLRFTKVGGVDPRILPGQPVLVHGVEKLPGIIVQPPDRLLPPELAGRPVPIERLLVDVGLPTGEAAKLIRAGDLISFAQTPIELGGETISGHTLDDRAAVAAVTYCLDLLQKRVHKWDVWVVATVQEETTFGGAYTSTYGLKPEIGIAIDVTHAKGPGSSDPDLMVMGKGLALTIGPNVHPYIYKTFKKIAEDKEIPFSIEAAPTHSGTDAYAIQVTEEGKPSMVISIPLRYMHTPVEMVSFKDIKRVGRLLAEFITFLENDYLEKINWDDKDEAKK